MWSSKSYGRHNCASSFMFPHLIFIKLFQVNHIIFILFQVRKLRLFNHLYSGYRMKKVEFKFSSLKLLITWFFSQLHSVVFFKVTQYPQRQESIDYHFQILILYLKNIIEFPGSII